MPLFTSEEKAKYDRELAQKREKNRQYVEKVLAEVPKMITDARQLVVNRFIGSPEERQTMVAFNIPEEISRGFWELSLKNRDRLRLILEKRIKDAFDDVDVELTNGEYPAKFNLTVTLRS